MAARTTHHVANHDNQPQSDAEAMLLGIVPCGERRHSIVLVAVESSCSGLLIMPTHNSSSRIRLDRGHCPDFLRRENDGNSCSLPGP